MNSFLIVLVVCVASTFGSPLEEKMLAQKDLISTLISSLGLGNVWSTVTALGSNAVNQLLAIGTQLIFASSQIWAQVKPILATLQYDLFNHIGDAGTIVAQSIAALNGILAGAGKRDLMQKDLISTIVSSLGLGQVWQTITLLGGQFTSQLLAAGTQLLFAGSQVWAQVTPILNTLKDDLINHTGDAVTIVAQTIASLNGILAGSGKRDLVSTIISSLGLGDVWTTITSLGNSVYLQFIAIGTQLLFASSQVWAQVKPILSTLQYDLFNHIGDAGTIVSQSIAAINQLLG